MLLEISIDVAARPEQACDLLRAHADRVAGFFRRRFPSILTTDQRRCSCQRSQSP
jgi:hypothetical protein